MSDNHEELAVGSYECKGGLEAFRAIWRKGPYARLPLPSSRAMLSRYGLCVQLSSVCRHMRIAFQFMPQPSEYSSLLSGYSDRSRATTNKRRNGAMVPSRSIKRLAVRTVRMVGMKTRRTDSTSSSTQRMTKGMYDRSAGRAVSVRYMPGRLLIRRFLGSSSGRSPDRSKRRLIIRRGRMQQEKHQGSLGVLGRAGPLRREIE